MRFNIVTIFPEFFDSPLEPGLLGRARERGIVDLRFFSPREQATDNYRSVDDRPYGGGPGMVMTLEPLIKTIRSIPDPGRILLLSPLGRPLDQQLCLELSREPVITAVCGRYEGVDARLEELIDLEHVSVGDFVLNGGEAALLCLLEAVSRLLPQFMGKEESTLEESFSRGLLEYPQYTRPEEFEGRRVPEPLLSGNHALIESWRREQAVLSTMERRPELLENAPLDAREIEVLRSRSRRRAGRNLSVALLHYPVLNKRGEIGTVSLTNLDIHDISRVSQSYGLGGFFLVTPLKDQQMLARRLISHWLEGPGRAANPDRSTALSGVHITDDLGQAVAAIEARCGMAPRLVATSARVPGGTPARKVRDYLESQPVLLLFGTGSGLAEEILDQAGEVLRPIRFLDSYNHLSVRSAVSVYLDRILGDFH
jgi:tRNA (guanine37-N1)-methyltransferase